MKSLLIRADASTELGSGHVMRCLALAQAWRTGGGSAVFALAQGCPRVEKRLSKDGIRSVVLGVPLGSPDDEERTIDLAERENVQCLVLDGYYFGARYQRRVKSAGLKLLVVDDYGHAEHYAADLLLNQNLYASAGLYISLESYTRLLLGTRYTMLRQEFLPWQGRPREIATAAHKVLVTLGGADPLNTTEIVLEALLQREVRYLKSKLLIGALNPRLEVLRAKCAGAEGMELVTEAENMPELMAWADVAISAGGSTAWELAYMGLPSLLLVLAANQRPVVQSLEIAGACVNLGEHSELRPADLARALHALLVDPSRREALGRRGCQLVDGRGAERVIAEINGVLLRLEAVTESDCRSIWEWANDPETRAMSFSSDPIPWTKHEEWFKARLQDEMSPFYLARNGGDHAVGQIRYAITDDEATVSVSLAPQARGRGYGFVLIARGSERLFSTTQVRLIHAYIKPTNTASVRAFEKAGFTRAGTCQVAGQEALHYVLARRD